MMTLFQFFFSCTGQTWCIRGPNSKSPSVISQATRCQGSTLKQAAKESTACRLLETEELRRLFSSSPQIVVVREKEGEREKEREKDRRRKRGREQAPITGRRGTADFKEETVNTRWKLYTNRLPVSPGMAGNKVLGFQTGQSDGSLRMTHHMSSGCCTAADRRGGKQSCSERHF